MDTWLHRWDTNKRLAQSWATPCWTMFKLLSITVSFAVSNVSGFHPVWEGEYTTPGAAAKSKGSPLRQTALYHFLYHTRSHDRRQSTGHVTMCQWQVSHFATTVSSVCWSKSFYLFDLTMLYLPLNSALESGILNPWSVMLWWASAQLSFENWCINNILECIYKLKQLIVVLSLELWIITRNSWLLQPDQTVMSAL